MPEQNQNEVKKVTWVGLAVNVLLAGVKFVGGIVGSSQAVVADAAHSLSDCSTDLAILIGVRYWSQPADANHQHGHQRIETLVTVFIGGVLTFAAIALGYRALSTIHTESEHAPSWAAFVAAVISMITKESLYQWTARVGRRVKSGAVMANAWHHRSDAMSSLPAALAVAGTMLNPKWGFLDHIGAVLVSLLILQAAWKIVRPAVDKLLDRAAPRETIEQIEHVAATTDHVRLIHAVRTRYVGCNTIAVDLHVKVDPDMPVSQGHDVSENVKARLIEQVDDVIDVVIHLEPFRADQAS